MNGRQDYLKRLVSKLFELTNRGKLKWQTTSDQDRFVVVLEKGTVEIEESEPWYDSNSGDATYDYAMTVHDESGRSLDVITQKDLREPRGPFDCMLPDLFRVARASALNSEEAVQELLTELDTIGLN
jgi:hypothetical protein